MPDEHPRLLHRSHQQGKHTLSEGPLTHTMFDAIFDAIMRPKRALAYGPIIIFFFEIIFFPIYANVVEFRRNASRQAPVGGRPRDVLDAKSHHV